MQVTVEMPDQLARQYGKTPDAVGPHVMEDAAIEGYRAGRLTQRQVGAIIVYCLVCSRMKLLASCIVVAKFCSMTNIFCCDLSPLRSITRTSPAARS